MLAPAIRLGVMVPMTGIASLYGVEIARAASIAADSVNERGGVLGRRLELIVADDGSLPESGVMAARSLVGEQGCVALIGNLLSNTRLAVCEQIAEPNHVPMLNFSFYEGSIFSKWFFHFAALPNQQIDRMIPYMADRFGPKMYFAGNNYEWPRGSIHAAMASLTASGGEVLAEEYLPLGPSADQVADLMDRVALSGADVFVPYFAGADQIAVLNRFAGIGLKDRMAVVMGHFDAAMAGQLQPNVRSELFASNSYFMSIPTERNAELLAAVRDSSGVTGIWPDGNGVVTNFGEGAFLCVLAFAAAVQATGSIDSDAVCTALEHVEVSSAQGRVIMDPVTHHATVNSYLAQCDADGTFTIVENFGRTPPHVPPRYQSLFPTTAGTPTSPVSQTIPTIVKANDLAAAAFETTDIPMAVSDGHGLILAANSALAGLMGYQLGDIIGHSLSTLFPPSQRAAMKVKLTRIVDANDPPLRATVSGYRSDGTYVPLDLLVTRMKVNGLAAAVTTARDITAWENAQSDLHWRATHDDLTGLANRPLITERLDAAITRANESGSRVGVLYIDLDHFKSINDHHGHPVGDRLLQAAAQRMSAAVRAGDTLSRLTGDEFLVVAENVVNESEMIALATAIADRLSPPLLLDQLTLSVSASTGIAISSELTTSAADLMTEADIAMYSAKSRMRGGYRVYDGDLRDEYQRQTMLQEALRGALANGEFECYYQPIVDLSDRSLVGMEALLRWHSASGEIAPSEFIPLAEASGAILEIGEWVLAQACQAEVAWRRAWGERAPSVSINVSARQLESAEFAHRFTDVVGRTGSRPDRLVLEITESALIESLDSVATVLTDLTSTGVRMAIDDFGTGYSSLRELASLPVSTLKIDRFFVAGAADDPRPSGLLESIVHIGRTMGLTIVAEGVETPQQRDLLESLQCQQAQGYLFARPAPWTADPFSLIENSPSSDGAH